MASPGEALASELLETGDGLGRYGMGKRVDIERRSWRAHSLRARNRISH